MPEHDPKESVSLAPGTPCVICGKPSVQKYSPFCSKRCADVDLHRWLAGVYVIPGSEDSDEDGGEGPGTSAPPSPEQE
jgi:endogenous inhibitor of DNA gyrase (YacG/DUF329 family)